MEKRNVYVVYGIALVGVTLDNMNNAAIITLQKDLEEKFNTNSSVASWVLSGYALTLGSFIMITGKIADIIGPDTVYLIGLGIMWITSLICALLPHTSIIPLIVFRAIQGIGASSLLPSVLSLMANYFSGPKLKHLQGAISALLIALTSIFSIGLILGGAFSVTDIGYRAYFWFTFSLALLCDISLFFLIIPVKKTKGHESLNMKSLNYISASLVIIGVLLVILGLTEGALGWKHAKAIAPLIVGVFIVIVALVFDSFYLKRYQEKHSNKEKSSDWRLQIDLLFPPEIIKIPNVAVFIICCSLYYAIMLMVMVTAVMFYQDIEHNSPIITALKVSPLGFGLAFGAIIYRPWMYEKFDGNKLFVYSGALTLGTLIWFSRIHYAASNSFWKYGFVSLFLWGYGCNLFFNIYMKIVVDFTPLHLQGVVNGIFQTVSQVFLSIGNALVPSIIGNVTTAHSNEEKNDLQNRLKTILYVAMGFNATFLLLCFLVKTVKKVDRETVENQDKKGNFNGFDDQEKQIVCIPEESCNDSSLSSKINKNEAE
ncbi:Methylenomycin A resistance protein [Pichia kudriavzevii]|nr:hypothetical protein JL09_g1655 [Pichia kudriavzevii]ONH76712.1 Methylenomycin A resistance protein [Pichia kudriavzevii]